MTQIGSLFTLFLNSPLKAFTYISDVSEMPSETWEKCILKMQEIEKLLSEALDKSTLLGILIPVHGVDKSIISFMQDDFLCQFVVRYLLCHGILTLHNSFKELHHFPSMHPPLGLEIKDIPEFTVQFQELTTWLNVGDLYTFS